MTITIIHPTQAAKLDALIKSQESVEEEEVISLSVKAKASNSMEDLLKNLQDLKKLNQSITQLRLQATIPHLWSMKHTIDP